MVSNAITHWAELRPGDQIEIWDGFYSATGTVDQIGSNAAVIWVHLDRGMGRKLYHCKDEVQLSRLAAF